MSSPGSSSLDTFKLRADAFLEAIFLAKCKLLRYGWELRLNIILTVLKYNGLSYMGGETTGAFNAVIHEK